MTKKIIDQFDMETVTWRKVATYLNARLQELRSNLEADRDEVATAKLRGQIREIKNTLALGEIQAPAIEAEEGE